MDKANDFTAFLTNSVNMKVPGELICKPHTQKLAECTRSISRPLRVRVRSGNGSCSVDIYIHHFCFGGICSKVVIGKSCIDDVDV